MADAVGTDALTVGGIVGGIVTLLGAIGKGIHWLASRADRRAAKIEEREEAYVKKIEDRLDTLEKTARDLWTCFGLVATALHDKDPQHPALERAAKILGDAFPIDLQTPAEMTALIREIDKKD